MVVLDPLREGIRNRGRGRGSGAVEVVGEVDEGVPPKRGGHSLGASATGGGGVGASGGGGDGTAARHGW